MAEILEWVNINYNAQLVKVMPLRNFFIIFYNVHLLYNLFLLSQGPITVTSYHITSLSWLLKQQIAVFAPYNFLSKLSTDIVTFSNIPAPSQPAANIWYFLSPFSPPLPLTPSLPSLPQPPAKKLSHGFGLVRAFCPLYDQFRLVQSKNILVPTKHKTC